MVEETKEMMDIAAVSTAGISSAVAAMRNGCLKFPCPRAPRVSALQVQHMFLVYTITDHCLLCVSASILTPRPDLECESS